MSLIVISKVKALSTSKNQPEQVLRKERAIDNAPMRPSFPK